MAWVVIPLAWYMQWQLPGRLTPAMLRGDMVITPREPADDLVMPRWAADFSRTDLDMHRILMLEVEARFRRLARTIRRDDPQHPSLDDATSSHAQQLAAFMASHYRESLTVARIAAAADLHPNYAMTFFKQRCGLSIWEYLTRLRISHAQRLLLTTDWKVHRIALESGFTTLSRFYEAFTRLTRKTPRAYRATTAAKA
jgi:transcriptional regulator GlxA family with amidase domain